MTKEGRLKRYRDRDEKYYKKYMTFQINKIKLHQHFGRVSTKTNHQPEAKKQIVGVMYKNRNDITKLLCK